MQPFPAAQVEPAGLEVMSDRECLQCLRSHNLGRIAFIDSTGHPAILPVNYYFDEGIIAFRTNPGRTLDLAHGVHVDFEIDGWDPAGGSGWSVVVRGMARAIGKETDTKASRLRYWPVRPAAPGTRDHWIGIWANQITGRRFGPRL